MSDPQINDYSLGGGQIFVPPPIEITTAPAAAPTGNSTISDIEPSQNVAAQHTLSAGQPQLPGISGDKAFLAEFLKYQALNTDKITNDMLDGWNKSLKEQAEQVRDMLKSPVYQIILEIQRTGNDGTSTAQLKIEKPMIVDVTDRLNGYLSKVGKGEDAGPVDLTTAPSIVSVMVVGVALVVVVNPGSLVPAAAHSPMESITQMSSFMQQIVPDISITNLDINLLVMPMLYKVSWDAAVDKTKTKSTDMQLASKFAQEVIKMTTTPNLIQLKVIDMMEGADKMTGKQKEELGAVIKLMMALTAFAFLYKSETGGLTSHEVVDRFMKMLSGEIPSRKGSEEGTLVKIIQAQLQILDPSTKARALEAIMAYMDSPRFSKDLDKMLDPLKTFENVFENLQFESKLGTMMPI